MRAVFPHSAGVITRDLSELTLTVERYDWDVIGGCRSATITATGDERGLWALLQKCGYGVEVIADDTQPLWWGYVERVTVSDGEVSVAADLREMYNRVAVAYTEAASGRASNGARGTTAWYEDAASIARYGQKELLHSASGLTAAMAIQGALRKLAAVCNPAGGVSAAGGQRRALTATLDCRGWWDTLDWRYAKVATNLALQFDTIGTTLLSVGVTGGAGKSAQSFVLGSAVVLQEIEVYLTRVGSPNRDITVSVCADDEGVPGSSLGSTTIYSELIDTAGDWYRLTLSSAVTLAAGTTYWLVIDGGTSAAGDYIVLTLDAAQGYGAGVAMQYSGSSWEAIAADMPFRLFDNTLIETSQQVRALITSFGQFLRAVRTEVASDITTESYRDGDSTALIEIEQLLEIGTSNNRRMLARVERDRSVTIFEEPAQPAAREVLQVQRDGKVLDGQVTMRDGYCPVGRWAAAGYIPQDVDTSNLSGLGAYLVERAEWDARAGVLTLTAAGAADPFDFGVQQG